MSAQKLTDLVTFEDRTSYLIRLNGEELSIAKDLQDAVKFIDIVAAEKIQETEGEWVKVYRQDSDDGKKVTISTQELGYLSNGYIREKFVVDCVCVTHIESVASRLK